MRYLAVVAVLASTALAELQLPFKLPAFMQNEEVEVAPKTIAIVGAGAGGSSAAFWISLARERFGLDVEIEILEQSSYIGGRSTTVYPYENKSMEPIELGASIFVGANYNLMRAAEEFELDLKNFKSDEFETMGIFDGDNILLTLGTHWYDSVLRILWRYGLLAPKNAQRIVTEMMKKYTVLYTPEAPRFDDLEVLAQTLGFSDLINQTTSEYNAAHGVSDKFIFEVLEAMTRVNYGQNVDYIHALEGACSMATTGATSVQGGNYQIFEKFVEKSGAQVYLNTTVHSIIQKPDSDLWTIKTNRGTTSYHSVILAAPFHGSSIGLVPSIAAKIPEQPYVHLHVTLLTTTAAHITPLYLNMPLDATPPSAILTTYQGAREGGQKPEFNSLSYLGEVRPGEWAVKIFSEQRITDDWLEDVFGQGAVRWVHRKEWDAYPKLPPSSAFAPIRLGKRLFYVNAFEPFISTMETETIASRNVVDLLLHEEFNAGICDPQALGKAENQQPSWMKTVAIWASKVIPGFDTPKPPKKFVLGWDC